MTACSHHLRRFILFISLIALVLGVTEGLAQQGQVDPGEAPDELLNARWLALQTGHFTILSELPERRTEALAVELESWRRIAAQALGADNGLPAASVPNLVYFFKRRETLNLFIPQDNIAYFTPTPRANYLAFAVDEDDALARGLHYYTHFLVRNFVDLRLPRWYEEALAGYLSRIRVVRGAPELEPYTADFHSRMAQLSEELTMEKLLYNDAALASPRLIQIASLKSESLLYYLLHGAEEAGFGDRRENLRAYLAHIFQGRNPRFAFDQSFDLTTRELDEEYKNYLLNSRRPEVALDFELLHPPPEVEAGGAGIDHVALQLGELALNGGELKTAEGFFRHLVAGGSGRARAYSGLGDSLRFQDTAASDQEISRYFETAREMAPGDLHTLLDYGEYWETELTECGNGFPAARRRQIEDNVEEVFLAALELFPDNPEVNLALGQVYLFEGRDWQAGRGYQRRAFELLPADTYIMEQAARYAIAAGEYDEAERLIGELAQPLHFYGEPSWVMDLRARLDSKIRGQDYDACSDK